MKEDVLLKNICEEDPASFEYLYLKYFDVVASIVLKNKGTIEDAKDIFQDMIIVLLSLLKKNNYQLKNDAKLSTVIYGIANNLWLKHLREERKISMRQMSGDFFDIADQTEDLEEKIIFEEEYARVEIIFTEIGEDCYKILNEFYFNNNSMRKIAGLFGYSEGYVRVKKNRCMTALRSKILTKINIKELKKFYHDK